MIPSVVTKLIQDNKSTLTLMPTSAIWYGVTYKEDKPHVVESLKKLVDSGNYKKGLWK